MPRWRRTGRRDDVAGARKRLAVEHPTGEFTLELEPAERDGRVVVTSAGLLRTARLLFDGTVYVP